MRRSRSRSRRGRQGQQHTARRRDGRSGGDCRQPVSARQQAEAEARQLERRLRGEASEQKSGQQRAREAIDREREKARLKKLEREEAQKDKTLQKERDKARRREGPVAELDSRLQAGGAAASPGKDQALAEEKESAEITPAASLTTPGIDEGLARKLFDLLDRGGKGQVSQRDVLIALRKQPPVRRLFGLPVTNVEEGGAELEARLLAIQDAFESGSGLGELSPTFEKLRAGGSGQHFAWEGFLLCCREEPMQARAALAVGLIPREHSTGPAFVATHRWTVVPQGAACPGGLEYKMDMETGKTLARLMPIKPGAKAAPRERVTTQTLACV
mmetsp:Transcript_79189/g.246592  ORF Transcript_79189/g.246592 Transcript_79189/m.246592 type:complete len:330 (+) Transcript_79189:91-1080(+)